MTKWRYSTSKFKISTLLTTIIFSCYKSLSILLSWYGFKLTSISNGLHMRIIKTVALPSFNFPYRVSHFIDLYMTCNRDIWRYIRTFWFHWSSWYVISGSKGAHGTNWHRGCAVGHDEIPVRKNVKIKYLLENPATFGRPSLKLLIICWYSTWDNVPIT